VVIPTSVTRIAYEAFVYNANLTAVEIPTSVRVIEIYAFQACPQLKCVKFDPTGVLFNESMVFDYPLDHYTDCLSIDR